MSEKIRRRLSEALGSRYALHGEIDRGGMAVVYLAEDLKHGRSVAIKVLDPGLSAPFGTERFLREIDVIAKLQHPHVLMLIDSGEIDGLPYYVMPYMEGQSLEARLEREGALPVEEAVGIAAEIADALAAAHERGIIHRDIKPGNVLLSGTHAMVADFGIAAALDAARVGRLTDTGVSLGSPVYMSPEQASGDRDLDVRTDIYGLGCILYEMLAGKPPFEGSMRALLAQKILGRTQPLEELRSDVPAEVLSVVSRAMEPDADDRFASAHDLRRTLLDALPRGGRTGWGKRRTAVAVAAAIAIVLSAVVIVQRTRASAESAVWASQQLAQAQRLADGGHFTEALELAREVESVFPDDTTLARLLPRISFTTDIRTAPSGARVFIQRMDEPEDQWRELGTTPIEDVRFAGLTYRSEATGRTYDPDRTHRLRFELDGYRPRELFLTAILGFPAVWGRPPRSRPPMDPVELTPEDPALEGMVRIPGFRREGVDYADYYMDRYEVTNAEFEEFVDAGAYTNRDLWTHPFELDDRHLDFDEAMAHFEDRTGRPGPGTWRLGTYPEGTAEYPVGGVSWYEAAAYAEWVGKELPTTLQWDWARQYYLEKSHAIVPNSNLGTDGPRPVGQNRAMTTLGVYDLVGNVREWCSNEAEGGQRATRGAAWTDAPFHVGRIIPKSPFDRDETHGFRLIRTFDEKEKLAALRHRVSTTVVRDYGEETPASDAEFAFFDRLYGYEPVPLVSTVERTDSTEYWIREVVSFDLPDGDRGGTVLYLPQRPSHALQPIVYWGGAGLLMLRSIDEEWTSAFEFLVRSGRAVAVPIFTGGYGRPDPRPAAAHGRGGPIGASDTGYRDIVIQWVRELRRTIDYLETRPEIETESVGFYGFSFGAAHGPIVLAVEPRIDAAVLNVGGLWNAFPLPEVDAFNFAPRVDIPVLMINGQHDVVFPLETNQRPLFNHLGTDPEHKDHYVVPAAHIVPLDEVIGETLDWFDRYLGVPKEP